MTYKEAGFRAFYHNFVAIPIKDQLKPMLQYFPDFERANYVLTYGYIARECGLTLEVLALAQKNSKGLFSFDPDNTIRAIIRIDVVEEDDALFVSDETGILARRYAEIIESIHDCFDTSEEIEMTREMSFLDSCRDEYFIDDVLVILIKDGLKSEGCWVRINGLDDHEITGTLLNEPYRDYGCHINDQISFKVYEAEDGKVTCYSDLN